MMKENNKLKLLIISSEFPPGPGGIGNHAFNLAKYLQDSGGLEVKVLADTNFTSSKEILDFDKKNSFRVVRIFRKKPIILTYLNRIISAGKLISQSDKIIFSGKFPVWMAGLFKSFFLKKDFVAVVHGSELDLPNPVLKRLTESSLKKCDKIISVSRYTQSFLPTHENGQKRTIIANGIDVSESDSVKKPDHSQNGGSLSLLTVGNVTPRKGQKNIIRALPEIIKKFPDVHYHVVGLPTTKDILSEFARNIGVLNHITFHGKLSRQELLNMYNKCDIFMMLSDHTANGDFEGFGIAVLEANILGKPAVGSRKSGIADAIDDRKTGVLVDQHNDLEIVNAIGEIYNNYEQYSINAYAWAIKHDWKNIVEEYRQFLNNA